MTRRTAAALAAVLFLAAPLRASAAAPDTTETFVGGAEPEEVIALARRFVLTGSERIVRQGRTLVPEVDYRLVPESGTLRLAVPLALGESLVASYSYAPLDVPVEIIGLRPQDPTPRDSTRAPGLPAAVLPRELEPELTIGGAKTLALEVGSNKDASVEQSLRVSVAGTIGEQTRLTALLSDQNIPLQPEGNTQRLEELDEVLVKIESPRAGATLGDFISSRSGTPFGDYERRLTGAEAHARKDSSRIHGVGAKARGNFRTLEFRGVEGKQGPYVLAGAGPDPQGVIVAGSERVWVDGRLQTRGDANDYVMDYSRGELEFTNRRLVTKDSEIAVDFEIAEQEYERNFYLGEGEAEFAGAEARVRASIAAETDSEDPLNFTLTEERRAALKAAGDAQILVPGAVCGIEGGDYDDIGGAFVYAGRDSGSCEVSFTFVGAGAGEYVRDRDLDLGLTFFRFVGVGLGDHTPGLRLAAPRAAQLAEVGMAGRAGEFSLEADGAMSREDRNRLSGEDDGDNAGSAGHVRLAWAHGDSTTSGGVRTGASARFRGERAEFASLGRSREVFLGERWNFSDSTRADEALGEVEAWAARPNRWRAGASGGVLDRDGLFRSRRQEGRLEWTGFRVPNATALLQTAQRTDDADSSGTVEGDLVRARLGAEARFGALRPGATYWKEERSDERGGNRLTGQDDEEVGGSVGLEIPAGISGRVRAARRRTNIMEAGEWTRESVGRTLETNWEARPGSGVRLRSSWIRRTLDFVPGRGTDLTTTLTRSDVSHENLQGLFRGEYVYETTSRAFVDRAAGVTGAEEPALALAASARLRIGGRASIPDESSPPAGLLRRLFTKLESETVARVEEETTISDRGPIYRLDFSRFQDDSTTVFGKTLLREEVRLFPGSTVMDVTGRWERIDTEDNRTDPERLEIVTERRVLRARNALAPRWTLESQGTLEDESRRDGGASAEDFDLRRGELREEIVLQPNPSRRVSVRAALLDERNRTTGASIRGLALGAAASTAFRRSGRLQGDLSWTHPTRVNGVDFSNRFRTRDGDQLEWRGLFELRLSESISGSVTVSGRSLEGIPTTHLVRAEARALF